MSRRRGLPDEIVHYPWSVTRWRTSSTREMLDATGRGIYRELLDVCYTQGSIPKNPDLLSRIAGCTREQFDAAWPVIARHFQAHKRDRGSLIEKHSELFRRQYFSVLSSQRERGALGGRPSRPKSGTDNPHDSNALETTGFQGEKPTGFVREKPKGKERKGNTKGKEKGHASTTESRASGAPVDAFFEERYSAHPRKGHRTAAEQRLCEVEGIETADVQAEFTRVHNAWIVSEGWQWKRGARAPCFDEWIADRGYEYLPNGDAGETEGDEPRYLSMEEQDELVRQRAARQ